MMPTPSLLQYLVLMTVTKRADAADSISNINPYIRCLPEDRLSIQMPPRMPPRYTVYSISAMLFIEVKEIGKKSPGLTVTSRDLTKAYRPHYVTQISVCRALLKVFC